MSKFFKISSGAICALIVVLAVVANMIIYILAENFGWYFTSEKEMDLSLKSEAIERQFRIAETDVEKGRLAKVKIVFCMTENDLEDNEHGKKVLNTAKQLADIYPGLIELDFINIITERDRIEKYKYQYDAEPSSDNGEERPQNLIRKTSVIFECGQKYNVLNDTRSTDGFSNFYTLSSDMTATSYNGEEVLASNILWITRENHPTAYFTVGHGESSSSSLTAMFSNAGYKLETLDLSERGVSRENKGNVLVISNPTTDFSGGLHSEIEAVEAFINNGGHVYVSLDPYVEAKHVINLTNLLEKYGLSLAGTKNDSGTMLRHIVKDPSNAVTTDGFTVVTDFADFDEGVPNANRIETINIQNTISAYHKNGDDSILVREAAVIRCTGNAYPVLVTSPGSESWAGGQMVDDSGNYCVAAASFVNVSGENPGTVFLTASPYLSSDDIMISEGYANKDFLYAVSEHILYSDVPPYACKGVIYDTSMLQGLTMGTARVYTVIACLIPAAIAVTGAVVIIRRKNR